MREQTPRKRLIRYIYISVINPIRILGKFYAANCTGEKITHAVSTRGADEAIALD